MGVLVSRVATSGSSCRPVWRVFSVVGILLVFVSAASARGRNYGSEPLSVDLPKPYEKVMEVVRGAVNDGSIRGASQYHGEDVISGASAADASRTFGRWMGPGSVLYKVRPQTLAPTHFQNSADVGTLAVRYVVQQLNSQTTRLSIDAIFVEDAHHHRHPSDGGVEHSEFIAINEKLKALDQQEKALDQQEKEAQEQPQRQERERKIKELQRTLEDEKSQLDAVNVKVQQLQTRAQELRQLTLAQVTSAGAELKDAPYVHSTTLLSLSKGQQVSILFRTPNWYRIRVSQGQEGWINHLFLEAIR